MLRPGEIEEALEQCLLCMQRGEPAEACLAGYPELREELAPLLAIAQRVHEAAPAPPNAAAALARGRERVLRQAARQRIARRSAPWVQRLAGFFAPLLRRGLASTVAAVVLIVVLLAGTSAIASANSLPGDPLYPVKLAAESVQLALTLDPNSRIAVEHTLEQRRVDEAQAIVKQHRIAHVSFQGIVEAYDGSTLTAAGLTIQINARTQLAGPQPAPGLTVQVSAESNSDGILIGKAIKTLAPAMPSPKLNSAQVAHTAMPAALVAGATSTQRASAGATPHPGRSSAGASINAQSSPAAATAQAVTTSPAPSASPLSPAGTVTPSREGQVHFAGLITRLAPDLWEVAGLQVRITTATQIDSSASPPAVGAWADVKGTRDSDGSILARKIVVERSSEPEVDLIEFQGAIEAASSDQWTVDGQAFEINSATTITGEPNSGWQAEVQAQRQPDGTLLATSIVVYAPQDIPAKLAGTIDEIGASYWLIAGRRVSFDSQTAIRGAAALGARTEVQGLEQADGSIRALVVHIHANSAPTATTVFTATAAPPAGAPAMTPQHGKSGSGGGNPQQHPAPAQG